MDTTQPLSFSGGSLKEWEIHHSLVASIGPDGALREDDVVGCCWPGPRRTGCDGARSDEPELVGVHAVARVAKAGIVEVIPDTIGLACWSRLRERWRGVGPLPP